MARADSIGDTGVYERYDSISGRGPDPNPMYSTLAGKKVLKMFGKKTMSLVPLNISFHVRGGTTKLGFPLHADWLYKGYIRALV